MHEDTFYNINGNTFAVGTLYYMGVSSQTFFMYFLKDVIGPACLSVYLFICLSICLSLYLSV
jgi:hypothetical protein